MSPPRPLGGCSARGQGAVLGRGVRDSRILGEGRVSERESPQWARADLAAAPRVTFATKPISES